ncbi:MAG TPA: hypothetical protein P5567_00730 [Kiritimatiellia bacterium]|nr:hypothetical protein [Kiritimatiellia bacterium]HRZ10959.1 hypothetical protein [Kiritimatiellia bacterium]HSA18532.1 hypothetical protein [Kiritimatiellia bacterium]
MPDHFFRSVFQNPDYAVARTDAGAVRDRIEIQTLRAEVERLLMIAEALWSILAEKFDLPEEELLRRIHEIDRRDGKLDGRVAPEPPSLCPKCSRPMEKRRPYCMYCGQPVARDPFER